MLNKIPYKVKFIILYILSIFFIVLAVYYTFTQFSKGNINNISVENFQNKYQERNSFFTDFFTQYITTIKALQDDALINKYINNQASSHEVESLFLTIKKSLPCAIQVRYIDIDGNEKVRVDGTPINLFKENAISKIVPKNQLQNKSNENYFKKFINLEKKEFGRSEINLNNENNEIENIKKPVVRFGVTVFDKNNQKTGIIVINVCLKTFFKLLDHTILYHVHLIDDKGRFISHNNPKYGLVSNSFESYTIFNQFDTKKAKAILDNDTYIDNTLHSGIVNNFNNGQKLKLILELKFEELTQKNIDDSNSMIYFIIFLSIILSPLVLYFARLPDFLKSEIEDNINTHKSTNLPNRISLVKDLENDKFQNSLVILVKIKNMTKIQNLYGYTTSEQLVLEIATYLKEYQDRNIKQIYMVSYGTFCLQYLDFKKENIVSILEEMLSKIEGKHFCADNDLDILVDIAISCSAIDTIRTGITKLKEAEIALDSGVEHKIDISIYSEKHIQKLQKNKDNIELAKKIKYAIENDTIEMHYQPIFNNFTEKIEKYEALIRLKYKDEYIFPDEFLPIAKELNKYQTLTYMVINKSFSFFQDKDYEFSINISMLDIENENFIDFLFERIQYYNVSKKLVLEIVESESVEDYDSFYKFIKSVKSIGCKVAIDDFGSGYSNFEHLLNLSDHIDYLKIDGSLVKNITTDSKIQILIGSLKFLCDNLRLKTIAEYVEDTKTLEYINSIGIDYSQGYLIGKPSKDLI
jgi:EAL domain-containing protein (putative c-di-GMP-specific phosphodiesterase class I)